MRIITIQKLRATNDNNGNPRKAMIVTYTKMKGNKAVKQGIRYITFDYEDYTQILHSAIIDENEYDYLINNGEIEITVKEYKRINKIYENTIDLEINF